MGDAVLKCYRCNAPAHWFDWTRAGDLEERTQPLCDASMEAICTSCAMQLDPAGICACQHCQREHTRLRKRS